MLKIKNWSIKRSGTSLTLKGVVENDDRENPHLSGAPIIITQVRKVSKPEGEPVVVAELGDGSFAELV